MKRLIPFFLAFLMLLSLCGCRGSFGSIDLQDAIEIPEDGIVKKSTIEQIKDKNAIAAFYGESNGCKYEWTIFGSDIKEPKEVNLLVDIQKNSFGELSVSCAQEDAFGFPALLSIHTGEKWNALSATAYRQTQAMSSVSITGNQESILNLSLTEGMRNWIIRPDAMPAEENMLQAAVPSETEAAASSAGSGDTDNYLSGVAEGANRVYSGQEAVPPEAEAAASSIGSGDTDNYLSGVVEGANRVYSDGKGTGQDKYLTDPIPEGKPMPVEPEDQNIDKGKSFTCTFSIECSTILNNLSDLGPEKLEMVPYDGVILKATTVTFYEGESVFDVLQRVCQENGIHMEASWTPIYNSAYVEGIHNLYEFDCGNESGWMYRVNGWYPNYGCSRYQLAQGDVVEWRYTCKGLGKDVGCDWMG